MADEKFHVVKGSRDFNGFSYRGPALKRTDYADRTDTSFDTLEEAVDCAQQLTEANPVGFEVYHRSQKVWPLSRKEKLKMDKIQFAKWIRAAMAARENSFDKAASDAASAAMDIKRAECAARGEPTHYCIVDHSKFYTLNEREAVASVVPPEFVDPVYLLLVTAWNDIQHWCDEVESTVPTPELKESDESDDDEYPSREGRDFNFEITFEPGTAEEKKCQHQVWAPNMLHAAFQTGQVFAEKFAEDFTIVPLAPVILKMEKA
jgi:hypothetical protein